MLGVVNISSFFKYYFVTNHLKGIVLLKDQVLIAYNSIWDLKDSATCRSSDCHIVFNKIYG